MASGSDPGRPMDIESDVVAVRGNDAFARVEAHADPQLHAVRPPLGHQAALGGDGPFDGRGRAPEDDEE